MASIIKTIFQFRRAYAAEWEANKTVVPACGEPCFIIDENILKIGDGETTFENLPSIGGVHAQIAADGKSVIIEDDVLKIMGFDTAAVGAQPRKTENGIEWIVPSTDTVEGLQTTVAGLQSDVTALQDIIGTAEEGADPLITRVETLETKMDGTGEGTVDAKIDAKINEFAARVSDDGTVNTIAELVDYVANHGGEAATMAADIAALQEQVGEGSVADRISAAVADKVVAEEGKSLVADELITKLEGVEEGAQANKIEAVKVGETLLDIVDKTVTIPLGAGLKASDEITIAEDGTLGIKALSFDKLIDGENTIIMDGGSAV